MLGAFAVIADLPDWRDGAAYDWLRIADPAAFAWEWLRRNRDYRDQALAATKAQQFGSRRIVMEQPDASIWGIHAFEDPRLSRDARPLWLASRDNSVLAMKAVASVDDPDTFSLASCAEMATVGVTRNACRLLLSNGLHSLRVDVEGRAVFNSPVRLQCSISGFSAGREPLRTWERLRVVAKTGKLPPRSREALKSNARRILLLRAFDALAAGATQREIAAELIRREAAAVGWRSTSPSLRLQVQRLAKGAFHYSNGRFWALLS